MNCSKCNKVFTCGCQKNTLSDGSIVCKNCESTIKNNANTKNNLSQELAKQQIQNLRG